MRKLLVLLMSTFLFILAACGNEEGQDKKVNENKDSKASSDSKVEEYDKKVASISIFLTGDLMALGIIPDGTTTSDYLPLDEERFSKTEYLGFTKEPDMEALIAMQPDEIFIDTEFAGKHGLEKYEAIAPTNVINLDEGRWKDHLHDIADIVIREETAEQFIKDYEAKAAEVSTLAKEKLGEGTVMAVRISPKGLRVYGMERPLGPILFEDVGFKPAAGVEVIEENWENISKEVLPDFDADTIFVLVSSVDEGSEDVYKELQNDPIWQSLKAVKNDQVFLISEQPWLDYSAYGNKLALDNLEEILINK